MAKQMTFEEASNLMNESTSSQLILVPSKQHIKLSPKYIGSVKTGVSEVLKSHLLFYNKELNGVPVAFRNIKALQRVGSIIADQACLHFDIEAEFILFKPALGCTLKGVINKVEKKHVGCLVHGCFNGWFPRSDVKVSSEMDLLGKEVEFKVLQTFSNNRVISLKGTFHRLVTDQDKLVPNRSYRQTVQTLIRQLLQELSDLDLHCLQKALKVVRIRPKTGKNAENDKLKAQAAWEDSLNDSLHIEPLMTSTQLETPAVDKKNRKKRKKSKDAHAELSELSEKSLDVCDSGVISDTITGGDISGLLENDDSLRKKKKKKKRCKKSEEVTVQHEVQKQSETQAVNVKCEVATVEQEVQKQGETQAKRKGLKRKIKQEPTDTVHSSEEFVSPRKKVKSEKKKKQALDSSDNDSNNNNLTKNKKSKKKKSKPARD